MVRLNLRGLDLFAGIAGGSLAMQAAGIEVVAHAEIEPFPNKVLEHRFPDVPNLGDVSKITERQIKPLGRIDVVSFGSPCQDWSVAGKRLGLKGHRSSLFHEAIRIIRLCKSRFAVFENVPGLFSSASGWDFAAVLDEMAESGALDIAWRVLDAQWFGVPQRRRRIFLVADFRGERAGEILSISQGVQRHPAPSREKGKGTSEGSAPSVEATLGSRGNRSHTELDGHGAYIPEVAGGQPTRYGKGTNSSVDDGAIIPIQDGREIDKRQNGLGVGNEGDPAYTLDSLNTQAVAFAENQRAEIRTSETHPQSTAGGGKAGQGYPAVAFHTTQDPVTGDVSPAMGTGTSNGYGTIGIQQGMSVRRLTPLECERLQGFPDDWTNIPGASDSARYRALGNAWAVPVGEWVMKRMARWSN